MFKEWSEVGILAGWVFGVGRVVAQNTVIDRRVRVDLDALLPIQSAVGTGSWELSQFRIVVAAFDRGPSGNTACNDTCHGSSGTEGGVGTGACVAP